MTLVFKRVVYGKNDTKLKDREYKMIGGGPCGNIKEIYEHAMNNGHITCDAVLHDPANECQIVIKDSGKVIIKEKAEVEITTVNSIYGVRHEGF